MTPKVLISFVTIILALATPAAIGVPCPTCLGAGHISAMPGAENLRVLRLERTAITSWESPCAGTGTIRSAFNVTLANVGSKSVHGIIEITAIDPKTGLNLTKRPVYFEMPANTTHVLSGTIAYVYALGVLAFSPKDLKLTAHIPLGEIACPSCGGKGKVSILRWPLIYVFGGLKPMGPPPEAWWEIPVEAV